MGDIITGLKITDANIFADSRGEFSCRPLNSKWIQENISVNKINVFRGVHLQGGKKSQSKLVRVLSGKVLDIVIDLRKDSKTYLKIFFIELNAEKKNEIYIPAGCGHAFLSLKNNTILQYLIDKPYDPVSEITIDINSIPEIEEAIKQYVPSKNRLIISEKDKQGISLDNYLKDYNS